MEFIFFSNHGSYWSDVYIKPYFYVISYVNGLFVGFQRNSWIESRYKFKYIFHNFYPKYLFSMYILIIFLDSLSSKYSNTLGVIQTIFAPSLISITLGFSVLENSYQKREMKFFSSNYWNPIRNLMRISYVFHPIIFCLIKYLAQPYIVLNPIVRMTAILTIHFITCYLYKIFMDDNIFKLSQKLSNKIFQ